MNILPLLVLLQLQHVYIISILVDRKMLHNLSLNEIYRLEQVNNNLYDDELRLKQLNLEHQQET